MIIAPRNPKRCPEIQSYLDFDGIHAAFMSSMEELDFQSKVVLVDKMGELSKLYAVGDVAFIGGSMVGQAGTTLWKLQYFPNLFFLDLTCLILS